jgi:hypothetical protein
MEFLASGRGNPHSIIFNLGWDESLVDLGIDVDHFVKQPENLYTLRKYCVRLDGSAL